jgi:hypothetical protein
MAETSSGVHPTIAEVLCELAGQRQDGKAKKGLGNGIGLF